MSKHKATLQEIIKSSMKGGDKETLMFARSLHAAVRKKEIDDRVDLDDAGFEKVCATLAKQRRESIEQFEKGGRTDLAESEKRELAFLEQFLPKQMTDAELETLVRGVLAETGVTDPKEMGKVMQAVMPKVAGRADGKRINGMVRSLLQS